MRSFRAVACAVLLATATSSFAENVVGDSYGVGSRQDQAVGSDMTSPRQAWGSRRRRRRRSAPTPSPTPVPEACAQRYNTNLVHCRDSIWVTENGFTKYKPMNLQACQGKCDSDYDCAIGLKCWTSENNSVLPPGCAGDLNQHNYKTGKEGYCYNPAKWTSKDLTYRGEVRCNYMKPCQTCQGNCRSDKDCDGELQCWPRSKQQAVPGCTGLGVSGTSYCYDPAMSGCTRRNHSNLLHCLEDTRWVTKTNRSKITYDHYPPALRACEGKCTGDSDCDTGLKCWESEVNNTLPVPGCAGDPSQHNYRSGGYCYDPAKWISKNLTFRGERACASSNPCQVCQGRCYYDKDCEGELKCWPRSKQEAVPGCIGLGVSGVGYCYDPASWASTKMTIRAGGIRKKGRGCGVKWPNSKYGACAFTCQTCQGDCDADIDCVAGLKCFQRTAREAVPGCTSGGDGDVHGVDFCYDPSSSRPTSSNTTCGKGGKGGNCAGKGKGKGKGKLKAQGP